MALFVGNCQFWSPLPAPAFGEGWVVEAKVGHVGGEFFRDRLHKRRRISGFLQRPLDAVAEARLLVKVRPAFGSEGADAGKNPIERSHRFFRELPCRQVDAGLREALQQLGNDRVRKFVNVLRR